MWTSGKGRPLAVQEPEAELGTVTLGGDPAAVLVGGERRTLPVYSPGGYCWRPAPGDRVLVLKTGSEREEPCVVGKVQTGGALAPGEVRLSGGGAAAVHVTGAAVDLLGQVRVNGRDLEELIRSIVAEMLSG